MLAPLRTRTLIPYLAGVVAVAAAWAMRFVLDQHLEDHLSFTFFLLAVSVAAWLGGIWPATFTAILSCLVGNYFFSHPQHSLHITSQEEAISLAIFLIVSLVIAGLAETTRRALMRARLAERAKDIFLATLAHELRSPLSVISYANEMNRLTNPGECQEQIDLIQRQVQQLDFMIQDLLDVSRVARGKFRLERKQVDAADIVNGAVEKALPLMQSHEHVLKVMVSPRTMPLYVDPVRIEQVLANLLTNAAKYTPKGGRITIRADVVGDSVIFAVRDNGIGIPDELLPRIFDLFVQAEGAGKNAEGGLGIGLALVRKVVELHDGSVRAASAGINRGSEFTVSLPLKSPARSEPSVAHA